jgi:hypothetical protein
MPFVFKLNRRRMPRFSDDTLSGLMFIALAVFFGVTASRTLVIGNFGLMGPGLFPILVSTLLAIIGVAVIFTGRRIGEQPKHWPIPWRAILFIIGAPVVFALTVRSVGLVVALILSISMAVLASRKIDFVKGALIVLGMTIFCVAVFSYGIGLTAQLFVWPPQYVM